MDEDRNGWNIYKKLVLRELERLDGRVDDLASTIQKLNVGQVENSTKLTMIGILSATVTSVIVSIIIQLLFQ